MITDAWGRAGHRNLRRRQVSYTFRSYCKNINTCLFFSRFVVRALRFRLYPTSEQISTFEQHITLCRRLYNACLEQRRIAWKSHGRNVSKYEQMRDLPGLKRGLPEFGKVYSQILVDVTTRVDLSFQAFFRRVKRGEKPGYPRFKSRDRYDSLTYPQAYNGSVALDHISGAKWGRVSLSKLADDVKIRVHEPVMGRVKTVTLTRHAGRWFLVLVVESQPVRSPIIVGSGDAGVDVGLAHFATLSTGDHIENPRYGRVAHESLARAQRSLSRKKRGSQRRKHAVLRVQRCYARIAAQREAYAYDTARSLLSRFDRIVVEDLQIRNMVKNRHLARSISDVAWGSFVSILERKAEEAGARVVRVPPHHTSQTCSSCGVPTEEKLSLNERTFECVVCGATIDRDVNAAINILRKAGPRPALEGMSSRRPDDARSIVAHRSS